MKSKKVKKLAKLLFEEVNSHQEKASRKMNKYSEVDMPSPGYDLYDYNDYDEVVSERAKKLIVNLFQHRDKLGFHISEHELYIGCDDLKSVKKPRSTNNLSTYSNYIQIYVYKDRGFTLNYNDVGITKYKDSNMYAELLPQIKQINSDINRNNFEETYQQIMKDSGVIREANLDEVFNLDK